MHFVEFIHALLTLSLLLCALSPRGADALVREAWLDHRPRWAQFVSASAATAAAQRRRAVKATRQTSAPEAGGARVAATMQALLDCYNIPGASISVTVGNETVYAEGFGVTNAEGGGDPVSAENTQFAIGSVTKTLTATLLAKLRLDGKFAWNDALSSVLGEEFAPAADVDRRALTELTFDDAASHRSGLARYDLLFAVNASAARVPAVRAAAARRLRAASLASPPRTEFQYSNSLFAALGHAAAKVAGAADWETLLQTQLLDPLGMRRTIPAFVDTRSAADGHGSDRFDTRANDTVTRVVPRFVLAYLNAIAPAGAVWSTAADMALLGRAFAAGALRAIGPEIGAPRNTAGAEISAAYQMPASIFPAAFEMHSYGRGIMIGSYRGSPLYMHGGNAIGHSSVFVVHGAVSVTVLMNSNGQGTAPLLAALHALDIFEGEDASWLDGNAICAFPCPWVPPAFCVPGSSGVPTPRAPPAIPFPAGSAAADALRTAPGVYRSALFGEMRISARAGGGGDAGDLEFAFAGGDVRGTLRHQSNGVMFFLVIEPEGFIDALPLLFAYDFTGVRFDSFSLFVDPDAPPTLFVRDAYTPRSNNVYAAAAAAAAGGGTCDGGGVAAWHAAELRAADGDHEQVARIVEALRAEQEEAEERCESRACRKRVKAQYENLLDRVKDTKN